LIGGSVSRNCGLLARRQNDPRIVLHRADFR